MGRFGIDYAWHPEMTDTLAQELRKAGVTFVGRYFSNGTDTKNLSRAEATVLSRNGLDIVCFWESTAREAENGWAAGQADARRALAEATACGMPSDRPIYFAVDEDTTVGPHIHSYFAGVASIIGHNRTGAYGSYRVIKALFDQNVISWGFQTYAWSNSMWDARAAFHQYSNGHKIAGVACDYCTAVKADFGQWSLRKAVPPTHTTTPTTPTHTTTPVHVATPPPDLCGPWPYGEAGYLGVASADVHCHSGFYPRDRPHVLGFQKQMRARGWKSIPVSGRFDAATQTIVRHFQTEKGIKATGRVDHNTWHHARFDPITK
jgi:hypothetical protein